MVRAGEDLRSITRDVLLIPTTGPRTAGALAIQAVRNGADLILAAGGDGTINEVVDGLANSHVHLGILPAGTANVLAHEIGLKCNVIGAARQMGNCVAERVSLGRIDTASGESRYFLMMAGVGFDALVIYHLSASLKDKVGKLSYFLGGLGHVGRTLTEFEAITDGGAHRCSFALISKVRNYGGDFEIAAEVNLRDDQFELVLFEGRSSWRYLRYMAGVATRNLGRTPGVCFARTDGVELRGLGQGDVYLQADGELIGKIPATIRIVPDALTLLIPAKPRR